MSEDITVLREIAFKVNNPDWLYFDNLRSLVGVELPKALAILCRREIERMEAEANQERGAPSTGHPIHPPSYDEGWNAALSAVEAAVDGMPSTEGFTIRRCLDAIRSLRKGPSND